MNQAELRQLYTLLMRTETIEDCIVLLDMFLEYLFKLIHEHHPKPVYNYADADAKIVNQMMFSKALHLKKLLEGVSLQSSATGTELNTIVDPTIIASLVRNVYETVCMFHLIFIHTKNNEEKTILYCLWVLSGLNYRQRFITNISTQESLQKQLDEEKQIQILINTIKKTSLYISLDEKNQKKIIKLIGDKEYKISFEGNQVKLLHWQQIGNILSKSSPLFNNIYTYFSLYAHPSHVAVFQFAVMFTKENEDFKRMTATNMKFCFSLFSMFIADYIKVFPEIQVIYDALPIEYQIMLNAYNSLIRGRSASINDAANILN